MIAASFLTALLAITVFVGAIVILIGFVVLIGKAIDGSLHPGFAVLGIAGVILTITTFIWLGSGPLNKHEKGCEAQGGTLVRTGTEWYGTEQRAVYSCVRVVGQPGDDLTTPITTRRP